MISQSLFPKRAILAMLCGVAFTASFVPGSARADQWDKKTILTVNEPIQIRDTLLQPGQYVMKLYDSQSDRHTVEIFNRDQSHIINTILAIPTQRFRPTGHTQFTFWETPPGTPRAMRSWYYPGDTIGNEFPYPAHLQQVAMASNTTTNTTTEANTQTESQTTTTPAPQQEAETHEEQQQTEIAQNTTPTPAPAPAEQPAPTPAPAEQPQQLPKTGSPYPLIGFGGLLLLGLYGVMRVKRIA
jgi:LPXTG-motif cell wall-anchored protein